MFKSYVEVADANIVLADDLASVSALLESGAIFEVVLGTNVLGDGDLGHWVGISSGGCGNAEGKESGGEESDGSELHFAGGFGDWFGREDWGMMSEDVECWIGLLVWKSELMVMMLRSERGMTSYLYKSGLPFKQADVFRIRLEAYSVENVTYFHLDLRD